MGYRIKLAILLILLCTVFTQGMKVQNPPADVFSARRNAVISKTGGGVVIVPGILRTPYGQRDESTSRYFWYLTGWQEPGALMLIEPGKTARYTLFVTPSNPQMAAYNGISPSVEEAMRDFHADTAFIFQEMKRVLPGILSRYDTIWYIQSSKLMYETLTSVLPQGKSPVIMDIRKILNDMRLVKDDQEISLLKKAIDVTAEAQKQAMMLAAPGRWEYELEAAIDHTFRSKGCDGPAFTTIVGSGANSTILHYETNNTQMKAGDVVVMDIGAKCGGYMADITRTIPISGKFSSTQLDIYNIVLKAQKEAIKKMIPDGRTLGPHDRASEIIMSGLFRLGLVTDTTCQWQKDLYILYTATHHIGLDIHDLYPYQLTKADEATFKPGMVITIEPGIYFSADLLTNLKQRYAGTSSEAAVNDFIQKVTPVFEKYKNIGIRIEDDILITSTGNIVLSAAAPKEPHDIERLMKKKGYYK